MDIKNLLALEIALCCCLAAIYVGLGSIVLVPMIKATVVAGKTGNLPAILATVFGACGLLGILLLYKHIDSQTSNKQNLMAIILLVIGVVGIPFAIYVLANEVRHPRLWQYSAPMLPLIPAFHMLYLKYRAKK